MSKRKVDVAGVAKPAKVLKLKLAKEKKTLKRKQEKETKSLETSHANRLEEAIEIALETPGSCGCGECGVLSSDKFFVCYLCALAFCDSHRNDMTECRSCDCEKTYCDECVDDIDKCGWCSQEQPCFNNRNDEKKLQCCDIEKTECKPCDAYVCGDCDHYHETECTGAAGDGRHYGY